MVMKNLILSLFLFSFSSIAADCMLEGKPEVSWVAFKTMKKVGVGGKFDTLETKGPNKGKSLFSLLKDQRITIDAYSVNTNNPGRDMKIEKFFFGVLPEVSGKREITGQITKVDKKIITIDLFMNGKKQTVPMTYTLKNNVLEAKGHIDVLDFALGKGLAGINKACYALHEGKTWSHVEIAFKQNVKNCKL